MTTNARATCETRQSHEVGRRTLARNTSRVEREPDDAEQTQKKMLCRLTLELSGGEAVRLERIVRRRDEHCLPTRHRARLQLRAKITLIGASDVACYVIRLPKQVWKH